MSKFSLSLLLVFFISLLFIGDVQVASAASTCDITQVGIVNFGSYDTLIATPPIYSTGSITIDCSASWTTVTTSIGPSPNSGGFTPWRKMKLTTGTDLLNYNLYTVSNYATIWGDGTQGTSNVTQYIQKNHPWTGTIYGQIPPGQDVSVGSYGESLVITINF